MCAHMAWLVGRTRYSLQTPVLATLQLGGGLLGHVQQPRGHPTSHHPALAPSPNRDCPCVLASLRQWSHFPESSFWVTAGGSP